MRFRATLALLVVCLLAACSGDSVALRRTITVADGPGDVVENESVPVVTGTGSAPSVDSGETTQATVPPVAATNPNSPSAPPPSIEADVGSQRRDSDRGVTDETITIGVITTLSGGQRFVGEPPYRTAVAYAEELNSRGGINGRRIVVKGYDVCIACPEDGLAQAKKAVEEDQVFAILNGFVANAALGPAMDYLASTGTPMIQTADGLGLDEYQFQFGLDYAYRGAIDADFVSRYLDENNLPRKVALLRFTQPLDEQISAAQKVGLENQGIQIVNETAVEYGAGMTAQSSQVAKMRSAGASMIVGSHGVACAFNMQAAAQAGWNVPYLCSILYGDFAVSIADDAVNGRDVFADSDGFAPLTRPGPGVDRYRSLMASYYPAGEIGLITMSSFLGMLVLEEGVAAMGDNVTREGMIAHLNSLSNYDAGGLTPPFTVTSSDHIAIHGAYILQLAEDRTWTPVSSDWLYPEAVHGLPR